MLVTYLSQKLNLLQNNDARYQASFWVRYWVLILRRNWVASLNGGSNPLLPEALLLPGLNCHPTKLTTGLVSGLPGYSGFLHPGFLGFELGFGSPKLMSSVSIELNPHLEPGPASTLPLLLLLNLLL